MRHLDAYMDGVKAGEIVQEDSGKTTFTYDRGYQNQRGATPLSLSMPLERDSHRQKNILPFLQGLLPDSADRLKQLGREHHVNPNNPVALLENVGADAAGAIQILPHGHESSDAATRVGDVAELSDSEFSELIADLIKNKDTWGSDRRHGRWSLPGAQPKVALFRTEQGRWATPNDSTPTTHILKPSIAPYSDHHLNEFITMRAAAILGLHVAEDDVIYTNAGDAVFISKRYDRERRDGKWVRLHQEDLCQALSADPALKYQSEGGPGVAKISELLRSLPGRNRRIASVRFFEALCFNLAMQGTDAHAKNFSLMLSGNTASLAPLYDLGSHAPYPMPAGETMRLAMSVDGEYRMNAVGVAHLVQAGLRLGVREEVAQSRATEILASTPEAYAQASSEARHRFGDDPFIAKLTDSIAEYATVRGWVKRPATVRIGPGVN